MDAPPVQSIRVPFFRIRRCPEFGLSGLEVLHFASRVPPHFFLFLIFVQAYTDFITLKNEIQYVII